MGIYLKLESAAGGTPEQAIIDACTACKNVGIMVEVNINGINVLIMPSDDPKKVFKGFVYAVDKKATLAMAIP